MRIPSCLLLALANLMLQASCRAPQTTSTFKLEYEAESGDRNFTDGRVVAGFQATIVH